MTTVGSYEAKTHLPALLERVADGENILITRRGVPIALLSPPPQQGTRNAGELVEEMLAYRNKQKRRLGKLSSRALIKEGRRF